MRQITVRYEGSCRKCAAALTIGTQAIYEKHVGIFCLSCGPTDAEEIREYRQEAGDRRADKYDEWAEKREQRANATLTNIAEHYTGDIAFNTQPGHIPLRARVIAQEDRSFQSLRKARQMRQKASSLRNVRVAGDAERAREERREKVRSWIKKGMRVRDAIYGIGIVERINKKTATIGSTGMSGTYRVNVELSFLSPAEPIQQKENQQLSKGQEIAAIRDLAAKIGPDSYIGPWLEAVAREAEQLIRDDFSLDLSIRETIARAEREARAIIEQAKHAAESIAATAKPEAHSISQRAKDNRNAAEIAITTTGTKLQHLVRYL